jgi:hypothetical protein
MGTPSLCSGSSASSSNGCAETASNVLQIGKRKICKLSTENEGYYREQAFVSVDVTFLG